jgi:hypothetical protein
MEINTPVLGSVLSSEEWKKLESEIRYTHTIQTISLYSNLNIVWSEEFSKKHPHFLLKIQRSMDLGYTYCEIKPTVYSVLNGKTSIGESKFLIFHPDVPKNKFEQELEKLDLTTEQREKVMKLISILPIEIKAGISNTKVSIVDGRVIVEPNNQ